MISKILTVLGVLTVYLACSKSAHAQKEGPEVGFLRIVNAVAPGEGNANILVDGKDLYPKGYKLGQKTGGFGIQAGSHTISIKKAGVETGTTKINLSKGETLSMIAFAERVKPQKQDAPPEWKTKILLLKQSSREKGYHLSLVPLCAQEEIKVDVQIVGKPQPSVSYAKHMAITNVDLGGSKPEVIIKVGGEVLTSIVPEDPGNYVVVFYEDESGKIKALSFYDPKFVVAG